MIEARKRKRAQKPRDEPEGDSSFSIALVTGTPSRSRLDGAQIAKLARSSTSAEVWGVKSVSASPVVRRIGQPVLSAQQASVAREAAREGTVCAKTLFRTL